MSCVFCKIANGTISSHLLIDTDNVIALRDISPQAPIHVLLIPKLHIKNVLELDHLNPKIMTEILHAVKTIAQKEGIDETGFRLVANTGSDGGQSVDHLHFHLMGGRQMTWPPG